MLVFEIFISIGLIFIGVSALTAFISFLLKRYANLNLFLNGISCIIIILGFTSVFIGAAIDSAETTRKETNPVIILIEDKEKYSTSHRINNITQRTTRYYFYFDDNKKIQVSNTVYSKFDIGDTIVIHETTYYKIDRGTGEETITDIRYNY